MRGIHRLIEGLSSGDPVATKVLIFAIAGTLVIVVIVAWIRKKRGY